MRLKSEIWVKAYLRRCAVDSVPAVVARRGATEAGAIYIKVARLDGTALLFEPAPAGFSAVAEERQWVRYLGAEDESESRIDDYLRGQCEFDPDIWLIEVEDRHGRHFMDEWLVDG